MERTYCSEQNRDEPMIGTADPVDVWLLLEYRPVWKARALEDSDLAPAVRAWLDRSISALTARGLKARAQLVRQPERTGDDLCLWVAVPDALVQFSGTGYGFLEQVEVEDVVQRPQTYRVVDTPHYFVCTNGQRDVCCARFGLPVYQSLRERVAERAWQVTHLGGHRFAPNVLTLPQGIVYGRVTPDVVDEFLTTVEAGGIPFPQVRGRAWYPPAVQAAEAICREAGLTFLDMKGDDAAAEVSFAGTRGTRTVRVRRADALTVLKSCGDAEAKPVSPYQAA